MDYDAVQNDLSKISDFVAEQQETMETLKAQLWCTDVQITKQILSRIDTCLLQNELISRRDIGDKLFNYVLKLTSDGSLLAELKSRLEQ